MEAWGLVLAVVGFIVLYRMLGPSPSGASSTGTPAVTSTAPATGTKTTTYSGPPPVGHVGITGP
jgi:hypothetical protein